MDVTTKIGIGVCLVIFGVISASVGGNIECKKGVNNDLCVKFMNSALYGGLSVAVSGLAFTAIIIKITPADPKEPATKGEKC